MKKFILSLFVLISTMSFAQYSSGEDMWGDEYYEYEDDGYYFPEEYYYEYPTDYYSNSYYRNFYRDYRRSITQIDWNRFFYENHLSSHQIRLILDLNNQFNSYYMWESYYRMNPTRWYYDRFYALERILGPRVYVSFQVNFYRGMTPIRYYTNRCNTFYRTRYTVRPMYRHYNIDRFRVNRNAFHQNNGRRYGWRNNRTSTGFRTDSGVRSNSGFRNATKQPTQRNNGFRNSANTNQRSNSGFRKSTMNSDNRRMRNIDSNRTSGVRNTHSSSNRYRNRSISSENRRTAYQNRNVSRSQNTRRPNVRKATPVRTSTQSTSSRSEGRRVSSRR